MKTHPSRREFLESSAALAGSELVASVPPRDPQVEQATQTPGRPPIKVVVWDERQPAQKQAYDNFLGNQIAGHLAAQPGISVRSVGIDDPGQGLGGGVLDDCQVLIWWGHVRNGEIGPEVGRSIVEKIKAGQLSLIALHSAHWSTPFVQAMYERTRLGAEAKFRGSRDNRVEIRYVPPPQRFTVPKADARVTPFVWQRKYLEGATKVEVHLPFCCFPAYRADGKPSEMRVLKPEHPIAEGIPRAFQIPQTEMYDEPFHVPEPDEVILEECWATGEWFRSGALWKIGSGQVFYFRPGHETFPVFKQDLPLKIVTNAVRWLARSLLES
jgi:trehalose utilization protein